MPTTTFAIEILLAHTEAGAILVLGVYLAYEIRFAVLPDVRDSQRVLGIAVYRIAEGNPRFDEREFRDLLWDEGEVFPADFDLDETEGPQPREGEA